MEGGDFGLSSIDNRIVDMQFNNGQFEKGIQQSIRSLKELKEGLELDKSARSLEKLSKTFDGFSMGDFARNLESVTSRLSNMGIVGMTAIQNITNSAINAGKQIAKSLSIDQIFAGQSKYELKTKSVQTIKAATGKSVEEVESVLDRLNQYTDETSYDFAEMANTIGKFTSTGVELEVAERAMEGIANEAAKSGAGIQEANRAMYNFAQALAAGKVQLMDWKSIELANMATKEFKEQLIQTALELGTLQATENEFEGATDKSIVTFQSFNSTLSEGWLTSDVLISTLEKYADTTTEFGLSAFHAAQQALTWTDAIQAVKDAVSTQWMKSFQLVFGNLDEAIELFTGLANGMIEVTDSIGSARNELLQEWYDLGGRTALIEGMTAAWEGLSGIIRAVTEAFNEMFPALTGSDLMDFTLRFKEFGESIRDTFGLIDQVVGWEENVVESIFSKPMEFIDGLKRGMKGSDIADMQQALVDLGYDLSRFGVDGIFGPETEAALKKFQEDHDLIVDGIFGPETAKALSESLTVDKAVEERLANQPKIIQVLGEALLNVKRIAKGAFAVFDIGKKVLGFFGKVIGRVLNLLSPFVDLFVDLAMIISDSLVSLNEWIDSSGIFEDWLGKIDEFLAPFGEKINNAVTGLKKFFGIINEDGSEATDESWTFQKIWQKITDGIDKSGIGEKLKGAFEKVKDSFKLVWSTIKDIFNKNIKEPLGEKFSDWFDDFIEKLPERAQKLGDTIASAADFISGKIGIFIKAIGFLINPKKFKALKENGQATEEDFAAARLTEKIANIKNKVTDIIRKFSAWKDKAIAKIKEVFGNISRFFREINPDFVGPRSEFAQKFLDVWNPIKEFFGKIKEAFTNFFKTDTSGEGGTFDKIKERFSAFGDIGTWFGDMWNGISSTFSDTTKNVFNVIKQIGKWLLIGGSLIGLGALGKKIWDTVLLFKGGNKEKTDIGEQFRNIALSVAIIAGSIAAIGFLYKADPSAIEIGASIIAKILISLTAIVGGLGILGALPGISDGIKSVGSAFKSIGNAIGIIAASIIVLGLLPDGLINKGFKNVAIIFGGLALFSFLFGAFNAKVGGQASFAIKGLTSLAAAIGILSIVAVALGKTDDTQFHNGFVRMATIMAALETFVIAFVGINKLLGNGEDQIRFGGLLAVAGAIGILAIIMTALGNVDPTTFEQGKRGLITITGCLAGIMLAVGALSKLSNGGEFKSMFGALAGLGLGLTFAIAMLTLFARGVGAWDRMSGGTVVSDINKGSEAISAVGDALNSFGTAFDILIGGVAVASSFVGPDSFLGIAVGLAGLGLGLDSFLLLFGGFVAGIGKLNEEYDLGIVDSIKSGGEILNALGVAIGGFAKGVKDGFTGQDDPDQYAKDMEDAGNALKKFNEATTGITEESVSGAVDALNLIADFVNNKLPKIGGVTGFIEGDQNFGQFATDLGILATSLGTFRTNVQDISSQEGLDADIDKAIAIAQQMHTFFEGLIQYPINPIPQTGYMTAPDSLSTDLDNFGKVVSNFKDHVSGFDKNKEEIEADTGTAIGIATAIKSFFDTVAESMPDGLALIQYNTKLSGLFGNIDEMGTTISDYSTHISGVAKSTIISDNSTAIEVIASISDFLNNFKTLYPQIEAAKGPIAEFFGGSTKEKTVLDYIGEMGGKLHELSSGENGIAGIASANLATDVDEATRSLQSVARFLNWISDPENGFAIVNDSGWSLIRPMADLGTAVADFSLALGETNAGDFNLVAQGIEAIATALALYQDNGDNGTALANAIGTISTSINENLGEGVDSSGLTSAIRKVCMDAAKSANGYYSEFKSIGHNLAEGLAQGIRDRIGSVRQAASELAQAAETTTAEEVEVNSPSRRFARIGAYCAEGMAIGLKGGIGFVVESARSTASAALSTTADMFAKTQELLSQEDMSQPVIRPVLDLSGVRSGAGLIGGMFAHHSIGVNSGTIASHVTTNGTSTIELNQNGSPDVVSAIGLMNENLSNLGTAVANMQMVTDTGALVGQIAGKMDKRLGVMAVMKGRMG